MSAGLEIAKRHRQSEYWHLYHEFYIKYIAMMHCICLHSLRACISTVNIFKYQKYPYCDKWNFGLGSCMWGVGTSVVRILSTKRFSFSQDIFLLFGACGGNSMLRSQPHLSSPCVWRPALAPFFSPARSLVLGSSINPGDVVRKKSP